MKDFIKAKLVEANKRLKETQKLIAAHRKAADKGFAVDTEDLIDLQDKVKFWDAYILAYEEMADELKRQRPRR